MRGAATGAVMVIRHNTACMTIGDLLEASREFEGMTVNISGEVVRAGGIRKTGMYLVKDDIGSLREKGYRLLVRKQECEGG